ncbi:MAG: hypothetical protein ABI574_00835 [Burkholderiales bacterium]
MKEFLAELRLMHKYLSTWVAFLASAAAAYWLQLSADDQQAFLAAFPLLKVVGPAAGFAAFVIARGWPQIPKD